MLDRGTIIDDKYEVLTFIGKGGMSRVYMAKDLRLNKQWAIKEIEKKGKKSGYVIESALAEANLIKRLDHPMLPRIVDIIDSENEIYIVMDYIEGEPLNKIVEKNGPQPQFAVIEWAKQLCMVLEYLHTRNPSIIYRDMKPGNIMLKPEGNIKLIDFGIAREYKEENDSDTTCLGTKGYAAPEQFGGKGQTDARTDIYCLGVTLYHLVTGHNPTEPPYEIKPIREWNSELSGGLEKIILKATQYNPEDRYQSCAEMLYALNHYEEVDDAYYYRQKRKLRRFSTIAISGLVTLGLAIGGVFYKKSVISSDYNSLVYQAKNSNVQSEKEKLYLQAIDLEPTRLDAYNGLIDEYKKDGYFTKDEDEVFYTHILKNPENHNMLKEQKGYSDLVYEIGCAYWYFYSPNVTKKNEGENDDIQSVDANSNFGTVDGDKKISDEKSQRMQNSVRWFAEVTDTDEKKMKLAKVYKKIGEFYRDFRVIYDQGQTQGKYKEYWDSMSELVDSAGDEEIVNLEVNNLVSSSIICYATSFKVDGVSKDEVTKMVDKIKKRNDAIVPHTQKTEAMKQGVDHNLQNMDRLINTVYDNDPMKTIKNQ